MTTNIELAKRVASKVELEAVSLKSANISSNFDSLNPPPEIKLSQRYRARYERRDLADAHRLLVFVDFDFSVSTGEESPESEDLAKLEATFLLSYELPKAFDVDESCFKHFADVNGPYNAWPYWRELVQSATGRIGLSGITVPVFRPVTRELSSEEGAVASSVVDEDTPRSAATPPPPSV